MGFSSEAVAVLLIAAVLKTGFCEELFFRGFVAKRLIARLGFARGNLLQAIAFMAVHVPMVLAVPAESRSIGLLSFVIVNPFMCSLLSVWLNEKQGGGSIVPGWILHAGANVTAYSVAAFWL
jgi:membrane protease YdiL (CAAX protease family)